jgi:hypothetical protein
METGMHSNYKYSTLAPLLVSFVLGCSAEPLPAEDVGSSQQAFSTAECASLGANATQSDGFWHESPRTYNKCYKGYIVDLLNYAGNDYWNVGSRVEWNDTVPTTQAACEALWMAAIIYETTPSGNVGLDIRNSNGVWTQIAGWQPFCIGPGVDVGDIMQAGGNYRVAVSARTSQSSSAPTRSVFFSSQYLR